MQVLFFVRLFADITGRMLPRMQRLAIESTFGLLSLALAVTLSIPLFFLYLKAPEAWLNDVVIIGNPNPCQHVHIHMRTHARKQASRPVQVLSSCSVVIHACNRQ